MAEATSNPLTGAPCYTDGQITCVNPPDFTDAYWLRAGEGQIPFGDEPGYDATGTVYLIGHASSGQDAVFTDLYKLAAGDPITITTINGDVVYHVQEVVVLDKSDWSSSSYANEQVPGRLILGTCDHSADASIADNGSSTQNILVVAQSGTTASFGG